MKLQNNVLIDPWDLIVNFAPICNDSQLCGDATKVTLKGKLWCWSQVADLRESKALMWAFRLAPLKRFYGFVLIHLEDIYGINNVTG